MSYDHRSYERNLSNCVQKPEKVRTSTRSRVETPLKSELFQASIRNCLNCVRNCDDHSSLDLNILTNKYTRENLLQQHCPTVTFCRLVWGTSTTTLINELEHIYARAAKTIHRLPSSGTYQIRKP